MMMFFRAQELMEDGTSGRSIRALRLHSTLALACFPVAALVLTFAPEEGAAQWVVTLAGVLLLLVSGASAWLVVANARLHPLSDEAEGLDEMEVQLRHRAMSWSYNAIVVAVLIALLWAEVANDFGLWFPDLGSGGLLFGFFLYAALLPTARLAWTMDASEEDEER